jgi:DNA polymerase-3 subunit delta'
MEKMSLASILKDIKEILKAYEDAAALENQPQKEENISEYDDLTGSEKKKTSKKKTKDEKSSEEDSSSKKKASKKAVTDFLDVLIYFFRDIIVYKASEADENLIFKGELSYIRSAAQKCSFEGLDRIMKEIFKAQKRLEANVNSDLILEVMIIRIRDLMI